MYTPVILPPAASDIRKAASWYNTKQPGLGKRFTQQVRKKVHYICKNPNTPTIRYDEVRTIMLDVFPYMVHYIVNDAKKQLIISAVLHTSRNPVMWEKRKPPSS